jgi:putative hemolysin
MILEILIVLVLTLVNGVLAMSELAVVSARPARLKVMAAEGNKGATVALKLAEDPGKFLSSVQIGITLVGILAGAFSGATLGERLAESLIATGLDANIANAVGVGVVVVAITYVSLIAGELVPKQIALRDPEGIAARVAPSMQLLAAVGAPLVFVLDQSGRLLLRILGQAGASDERVTDEEVKTIIAEAESQGVLETEEKAMITGVMRLADRSARGLMTPRLDVETIDLSDPPEETLQMLRTSNRSMLPVHEGEPDKIIGVLVRKDLIDIFASDTPLDIRSLVKPAPVVLDRADAISVLAAIRNSVVHMALVFDEYGHFEGIVTPADVLEAIAGVFRSDAELEEPHAVSRDDGSWLLSGAMPADEMAEQLGIALPAKRDYHTAAGFLLAELRRLPAIGESVEAYGWRFEIVDLDGRRIDKMIASRSARRGAR